MTRFLSENIDANQVLLDYIGAADIELTEDELSMLNETLAKIKVVGSRVDRVKKDY